MLTQLLNFEVKFWKSAGAATYFLQIQNLFFPILPGKHHTKKKFMAIILKSIQKHVQGFWVDLWKFCDLGGGGVVPGFSSLSGLGIKQ